MTSLNIGIISIIFALLLLTMFHQRDQILSRLKTSERDNHQAVMDTFRQKGKICSLKLNSKLLRSISVWI